MDEKTDIKAVDMVRKIRDRQAADLRGKSDEEIIKYFRTSGKTRRKPARRSARPANKGREPSARKAHRG